jgi:uncharacterized protein YjbI with pentapeptide repeats
MKKIVQKDIEKIYKNHKKSNANSQPTDCSNSILEDIQLKFQVFNGANFANCKSEYLVLDGTKLEETNFSYAYIKNSTINKVILSKADLSNSTFINTHIVNTSFWSSNCYNIKFINCTLNTCNFDNANLENASFKDCYIKKCTFLDSTLDPAVLDETVEALDIQLIGGDNGNLLDL